MQTHIMPLYANTHSMQSASGKQTIYAREEARSIVKRACNADENDALIFTGAGATSAINLFVNKLGLKQICDKVNNKVETEVAENDNYC